MDPSTVVHFMDTDDFLKHWQGHRALTRRVIEAFPDEHLFTFSIGGMRPFGELVQEMLGIAVPMVRGMITDEWTEFSDGTASSKKELLRLWDADTKALDELWPSVPKARFAETFTSFGQFTGPGYEQLLYVMDNEVHHRGQGTVYLRALEIEPPAFWER
ncbi:DinB family protein [Gemmatimonadota bacterium Y43]|uniref:DinB family protein n=1 Tax=Gaopeijia maritima TaxID=3119007 RepID=UPI0032913798